MLAAPECEGLAPLPYINLTSVGPTAKQVGTGRQGLLESQLVCDHGGSGTFQRS